MTSRIRKFSLTIMIAIFISLAIAFLSSCVSKHPKCAAYDKIESVK